MTTDEQLHSVRLGKWRLIMDAASQPVSLFNLELDPDEHTDESGAHPDVRDELLELLKTQRDRDAKLREELDAAPVKRNLNMGRLKALGYVGDE